MDAVEPEGKYIYKYVEEHSVLPKFLDPGQSKDRLNREGTDGDIETKGVKKHLETITDKLLGTLLEISSLRPPALQAYQSL